MRAPGINNFALNWIQGFKVSQSDALLTLQMIKGPTESPTVLNIIAFGIFGGISMFRVEFMFQKTWFSCAVMSRYEIM